MISSWTCAAFFFSSEDDVENSTDTRVVIRRELEYGSWDDFTVVVEVGKNGNGAILVDFSKRLEMGEKAWHVGNSWIGSSPGLRDVRVMTAVSGNSKNNNMAFIAWIIAF
mmetsp:Transcript_28690/g.59597  ORF Transcript_28690/g.59597 Transcript_28690/m.59597 type:complete len:110 (-) Transcript_28690:14-343(-)